MNKNLFLKEFRRISLSLLLWIIVITVLISVTMSFYRTFLENQSQVLGLMSIVPKEALQFKGISNFEDLFSVMGFYSVNNIIYMMLLGSIFAIVQCSNILLKEEYNKTAEYLLTWPLSRREVFATKLTVVFTAIILLNLATALAGYISMVIVEKGPISVKPFLILSTYTCLLNLLFGSMGLFMSTAIKRPRPITTFSIGLVLVFYFIHTISKITESAALIGYLSPFKFAGVNISDPQYRLEPWHLVYFLGISMLLTVTAWRLYRKRNIYI